MNIDLIAKLKDYPTFLDNYQDGDNLKLYKGKSLLFFAMANNDPDARFKIASFLLDKGTDVLSLNEENENLFHVLFSRAKHNIDQTALLCGRLLQKGLDINQLDKKNRHPLQYIISSNYSDNELFPLYEMIFTKTLVDAAAKNDWGFSLLELSEKLPHRSASAKRLLNQ